MGDKSVEIRFDIAVSNVAGHVDRRHVIVLMSLYISTFLEVNLFHYDNKKPLIGPKHDRVITCMRVARSFQYETD